jgi:hypothetical protein
MILDAAFLRGQLLHAITYYRGTNLTANLDLCNKLYEIVSKEALSESDYQQVNQRTLETLDGSLHMGSWMYAVVELVDRFLANNWKGFVAGSLLAEYHKFEENAPE